MLIYEKFVEENGEKVRHLYGSETGIPADTDTLVTYKDVDGDAITPVENDTYLDDGAHGIIRKSDEKFVAAFVENTCIVPNTNWTPAAKELKEIKITKKPTKTTYTVGDKLDLTGMKVQAIYTSGDKDYITNYTTSPATTKSLATTDTEVTVTFNSKTAKFAITVG